MVDFEKELEEEFWEKKNKVDDDEEMKTEKNVKYILGLIFLLAVCLWIGFKGALAFPLHEEPAVILIEEEPDPEEDGVVTILLVGSDKREGMAARSDTMMVFFLNKEEKTVDVLSVPRDTYVQIPAKKITTKINHAYAYGGVSMAAETVEHFLDVDIDHYVDVDFEGFKKTIDALGGVELAVDRKMYYPAENIDLEPGLQTLDGYDALGYVRFRGDGQGDIGRVARQQKFLHALSDEVLRPGIIWKIPQLAEVFKENVSTDLELTEILSLVNAFKSVDTSLIKTYMLPGKADYINGVSYWITYRDEVRSLMETIMLELPEGEQTLS